jgi:adenylyltransferase/sulfurtransferase
MPRQINVRDLSAKLAAGVKVHLVDVREPWEHETAALPQSQLIPLGELGERATEVVVPDGALLVVYCHHGVRSLSGAAILEHHGHKEALSLAGGIDRWSIEIDPNVPRY